MKLLLQNLVGFSKLLTANNEATGVMGVLEVRFAWS